MRQLGPAEAWTLHFAATAFMTGLIWLIQRVHYPMLAHVERGGFASSHAFHSARITPIVAPAMVLEAATGVALVLGPGGASAWVCLGLSAVCWLATALLSVPEHSRLAGGHDEAALRRLVATNWVRTIAWSAHLGVCVFFPVA